MSLTEDRILSSIELNLEAYTVDVLWKIRILRDGEVIDEKRHRGAYPVNAQGEVDDTVRTLLGASLQDILGVSAANAMQKSVAQETLIATLVPRLQAADELIAQMNATIVALQQEVVNLQVLQVPVAEGET